MFKVWLRVRKALSLCHRNNITLRNYGRVFRFIKEVKKNHEIEMDGKGQDAIWVCVKFHNKDWREAKKAGAKKDSYHGWILYSTSTNSRGYDLYESIKTLVMESGLKLRTSYLDL